MLKIKRTNQRTFTYTPELSLDFTTWLTRVSSASNLSQFAAARVPVKTRRSVNVPSFLEQMEMAFLNKDWMPTPRLTGTLHASSLDFTDH